MMDICKDIVKIVFFQVSVLISGESGIGKELIVRVIYYNLWWVKGLFIKVNCVVLLELLFESELFGYEKGVFIGV